MVVAKIVSCRSAYKSNVEGSAPAAYVTRKILLRLHEQLPLMQSVRGIEKSIVLVISVLDFRLKVLVDCKVFFGEA
jgi:hypothetical protein